MKVDESAFFREAALLICGDLDIEQALVGFLRYPRKFMPADRLILERLDEDSGSIQSIISVTPEAGKG